MGLKRRITPLNQGCKSTAFLFPTLTFQMAFKKLFDRILFVVLVVAARSEHSGSPPATSASCKGSTCAINPEDETSLIQTQMALIKERDGGADIDDDDVIALKARLLAKEQEDRDLDLRIKELEDELDLKKTCDATCQKQM